MPGSFFGGIHPGDGKKFTNRSAIEILKPPSEIVIPLSMHTGAPAQLLVGSGDTVLFGQKIGEAAGSISVPVHASVSGIVKAVEPRLHPNGRMLPSVVIENDGNDTKHDSVISHKEAVASDSKALVDIIRESGVVGMGGAAFPTHFKISSALGKADTIIINGAECEPYITSDHRIILESPDEVIAGVRYIIKAMNLKQAVIAIETNKKDAIALLETKLSGADDIKIKTLKTRYPQGAEKQLIQSVTRRFVPPGGLPADVGCAVFNIYTAWTINRAVTEGIPAIDRIVTVSGPGIKTPKNLRVRVGTPVSELIGAAGGLTDKTEKILLGGPMMGNAIYDLSVPVIKGTNAVLALTAAEDQSTDKPVCIRCGRCISVCPMKLQPIYMYMYERKDDLAMLQKLNLTDCMECGSCNYICPGRLHLVQSFRNAKPKLNALRAAQQTAK